MTVHADFVAVTQATCKSGASLRDQFKYGGCYKREAFAALKGVLKVACKSREEAIKEGWEEQRKANGAADEVGKLVRPETQCKEKEQLKVTTDISEL